MGLFDSLFGKKECPVCHTKGARVSDTRVRCPNPSCRNFDGTVGRRRRRSDYSAENSLTIWYRNFQNQEKAFNAEASTLYRAANHIVAQVAPTGERISLSRDRIQNLEEVERAVREKAESAPTGPTARERQVLNYHKKHKTTSPLYEKIREKYPDW